MVEYNLNKKIPKNLLFFNEAVEYFNRFDKNDFIFNNDIEDLNPNQLRDQMLDELNNLRLILANHPDLKLNKLNEDEKAQYNQFIKFYSVCPVCGDINHYHSLKKLFFDENNQEVKQKLLKFIDVTTNSKLKRFNIDIGIPCCKCFKNYFEKKE